MPSYHKLHLERKSEPSVFGATAPHLMSSISFQGARVSLIHPALPQVLLLGRLLLFLFSPHAPAVSKVESRHR